MSGWYFHGYLKSVYSLGYFIACVNRKQVVVFSFQFLYCYCPFVTKLVRNTFQKVLVGLCPNYTSLVMHIFSIFQFIDFCQSYGPDSQFLHITQNAQTSIQSSYISNKLLNHHSVTIIW